MQKVLVSGSAGFIGGYLVEELLARGYAVVGIDNFSKYGKVTKSYDDNPNYELVEGDARDIDLMTRLLSGCDTPTPTTCWRRTSGSSPPPVTRRSPRTRRAG